MTLMSNDNVQKNIVTPTNVATNAHSPIDTRGKNVMVNPFTVIPHAIAVHISVSLVLSTY